jgi:solute carrier family 25 carnitine/acylcarnitine transporter 20/29
MALADLVAGTFAGFAICGVGHPFDTLKVMAQMQPDKYSNMVVAARDTVRKHGPGGLYKGVGSPLVGNGLYNAVQFAVFARLKDRFTDGGRAVTVERISQAAAVTGIFVACVEGPQDLFKSQVQAQMVHAAAAGKPKYAGTLDCARVILRERGLAGAFQGLQATVLRNFVGVGAYFAAYEALRLKMAGDAPVSSLSAWHVMFAGGCGG